MSAMTIRNTYSAIRPHAGRAPLAGHRGVGREQLGRRDRGHRWPWSRIIRVEEAMIGTSEITSSTTAIAEPKPSRLASLIALLVISVDSSSRPFLPRLMMYDDVERPQGLDRRDHDDHDVDRHHHREHDPEERLALVGAVDLGGLAQRRVERLQAGQVEDHDVADVAPARGDEHRPEVEARVAEPVDQVVVGGPSEHVVDEPLLGRVLQLPDDPDDGQRQHDRQVEHASGRSACRARRGRGAPRTGSRCGVAMNISHASQIRLC